MGEGAGGEGEAVEDLVKDTLLYEGDGTSDFTKGGCYDAAMAAVAEHHAGDFC